MKNKLFLLIVLNCAFVQAQERTGIAIDPSANNIAALFTMTDEGGRLKNLELMESVFKDKSLGFSCERHHNVSSNYIYNKMTELTSKLNDDATLLLYFNSHGGGSGDRFGMTAKGGSFKFSKGLDALKKANKKIKRLIFLVDTCHAEGSIQDSLKQDGELLKNIKIAKPTNYLPELPSKFSKDLLPFISVFINPRETKEFINGKALYEVDSNIDYGQNSGVYDEILIISSSSVEDLSIRGAFASRLASTFNAVKNDKNVTVGDFLKKFALSHGSSGQQPHYKILPGNSMFGELLFGPWFVQTIKIKDHSNNQNKFDVNFIPVPSK
jgi:hypothetical protein